MISVITLSVALLAAAAYGRELSVNMKVAGVDYSLTFNPETTAVASLAKKFCIEQGGRFGVTAETLDNCISPVTQHLQTELEKDVAARGPASTTNAAGAVDSKPPSTKELTPLVAKFKVEGLDYQITFYPTLATPERVANEFCRQKGGEFGITEATFSTCTNAVARHVAGVAEAHQKEQLAALAANRPPVKPPRTVAVDLTIGSQDFHLRFEPETTATTAVATQLCTERGASFGVTSETLQNCVAVITQYLDQEVAKK